MTGYRNSNRVQNVCVDQHTEFVPGEASGRDGVRLYHVEVNCAAGILCPPTKEVTCTVCTK